MKIKDIDLLNHFIDDKVDLDKYKDLYDFSKNMGISSTWEILVKNLNMYLNSGGFMNMPKINGRLY